MIETHGLLMEERMERANDVFEQVEASHAAGRFGEYEPFCEDCGRTEAPGEEFEEFPEGHLCRGCLDRRAEQEAREPGLLTASLIDWYDRAGGVPTRAELKTAIEQAAVLEGFWGKMPWESEWEFDQRRTSEEDLSWQVEMEDVCEAE